MVLALQQVVGGNVRASGGVCDIPPAYLLSINEFILKGILSSKRILKAKSAYCSYKI